MGAGKLRVLGVVAAWTAALAGLATVTGGCGGAAPATLYPSLAPGQTAPPLTPTMTPSAVPALGGLTLGPFPSTLDGGKALQLCEDWAVLRGQYAARVEAGATAFQMEQWFSSAAWQAAFKANGPLQLDPDYGGIVVAFGMATIGQSASIAAAKRLDAACAAAD
jgi:hypothetical protein